MWGGVILIGSGQLGHSVTLQLCKHSLDSILGMNQSGINSLEIKKMKCYNFFNMSTKLTLRGDEMYPRKADGL